MSIRVHTTRPVQIKFLSGQVYAAGNSSLRQIDNGDPLVHAAALPAEPAEFA